MCSFPTVLHWKSNTTLHHKVSGPCFIFPLDNLNEWIHSRLSLRRFNITWLPSFSNGTPSCLPHFFNLSLTFSMTTFSVCSGMSEVCLWVKYTYDNFVFHCVPMFCFHYGHPTKCTQVALPVQTMAEKSMIYLLWHTNKCKIIQMKDTSLWNLNCTKFYLSDAPQFNVAM